MNAIVVNFLLSRLLEASTWRGIVTFVSGLAGAHLSADVGAQIVSLGVSLAGLLGAVLPDRLKH